MAINTNTLKVRVESLAKKSQHGYLSSVSFNSDLQAANLTLYQFFYKQFEDTQNIVDGLLPFIKEVSLPLAQGTISATTPFPFDYHHRIECGVLVATNQDNDCDDDIQQPTTELFPVDYLVSNEEKYTLTSAIRKPNLAKNIYRHTFKNNLIHVYPRETRALEFKYFRKPAVPYWDSYLNITANGDVETFIPVGGANPNTGAASLTVSIEFEEEYQEQFTDLLLFYLGVQLRETDLIVFAKEKMAIS